MRRLIHKLWHLRLKLVLALALMSLASLAGIKATSTPNFCSTCHEMKPEFATWAVSAHQKIDCVTCHIEPGVINFVKHKIGALNQVKQHLGRSYLLPIELPHEIKNEVCLGCHSLNREPTPSGDLKIPHRQHLDQDVSCTTCHRGVAHGQISEREQTIDGNFARWTMVAGRAQMVRKFRVMEMKECLECHQSEQVTTQCEACHKTINKPKDHEDKKAWERAHGPKARQEIKSCDRCHSYTKSLVRVQAENPTAEYARSNTFCQDCHEKKPLSHSEDWRGSHSAVLDVDRSAVQCQACHDTLSNQPSPKAAQVSCGKCHTSKHQIGWKLTHPVKIGTNSGLDSTCIRCHNRVDCAECHTISQEVRKRASSRS